MTLLVGHADARPRSAPQRLVALVPLLEFFRQRRAGRAITVVLSDGRKARTAREIALDIAQQHGISRATVWRWHARYKPGDLARRRRSDAGASLYFQRRPDAAALLARLLKKKRSAQEIYETLRRAVPAPAPCYGTVATYSRRLRAQARAARRRRKQPGAVA
ncbi:MAG: helix-turn-helix domain-containing protein [Acidobacteriia bacterium]|nr:helix-turn-helix domain-containing protein [Terriglobia bacterium]